jgi:hypothetical protein
VASLTVTPREAGSASSFDASASRVAYGTITSYAWNFGDGTSATTTTPAATHAYAAAGVYTATLTETDSAGTSTRRVFTGQTVSRNGGPSAATSRSFVVIAHNRAALAETDRITPVLTDPLDPLPPPARPVAGRSMTVIAVQGRVNIQLPGAHTQRPLTGPAQLPLDTVIDTRRGKITIAAARDRKRATQQATFWGGVFRLRQPAAARLYTDIRLVGGDFRACPSSGRGAHPRPATTAGARHRARPAHVVRQLWVKDRHGRFTTHGRDSVSTVRGTVWLTQDRCDGTLTRVVHGMVFVRDRLHHRSALVLAGHRHLAPGAH